MRNVVLNTNGLEFIEDEVCSLTVEKGEVKGVILCGEELRSKCVILTAGTFLNGLIHIGKEQICSGRDTRQGYERSSNALADNLRNLGFKPGRLKTGTVPRLRNDTIDYEKMEIQPGDDSTGAFSFFSKRSGLKQVPCYITYTNERTHEIISRNINESALYGGDIKGRGARYCPSIEDKLKRFPEKDRHQVFIEPEGLNTEWIYPNGISNSLPEQIQVEMIRSINGLETAEMIRPGYAIEYDYYNPVGLFPWLETKRVKNLFFAGQINGTSGYEEAAAQGLMAGINAANRIRSREPYIISRSKGYIGVLIDDLVTGGTQEPYRMFTSRAEYRLLLREDNADRRLCDDGYKLGLLDKEKYEMYRKKKLKIEELTNKLTGTYMNPDSHNLEIFKSLKEPPFKNRFSLKDALKRKGIDTEKLSFMVNWINEYSQEVKEQVQIDTKYEGYLKRQNEEIKRLKNMENVKIPSDYDYCSTKGLTNEVVEKLCEIKPLTIAQASRISGVTPAAISSILISLKAKYAKKPKKFL
jgi:tRNA uridine 5-carboxymethylaminomethyl modification enzyme